MHHFNSGSLTIITYRKKYIFEPYSSRGGYKHFNRIFQLHGDLDPKVSGQTSISLISVEASKTFKKHEFNSKNP